VKSLPAPMPSSHAQATHGYGGDRSAPTTVSTPALASPSAPLIRAFSHRGSAARAGSIIAMVTDVPSAENADQTLPASQLPRVRSNLKVDHRHAQHCGLSRVGYASPDGGLIRPSFHDRSSPLTQ
jgi:hypothetical protein